jgi:NTE family protein
MVDDTTPGGSHDIEVGDAAATWPVQINPGDSKQPPKPGTSGLCLSGGGSRAMLFHVGALRRLNELGLLARLNRISSVSGGSIVSGLLGIRWKGLGFVDGVAANFEAQLAGPIMDFASVQVDIPAGIRGVLLPRVTAATAFTKILHDHLYGDATLQDLPNDDEGPRFVINATNLQSGVLFRFSKPYVADYKVGMIEGHAEEFPVAVAVAASAAFPPFFAPVRLDIPDGRFKPNTPEDDFVLGTPEFQRRILLADGGVYDNLGLETVFKSCYTIYASDGGGRMKETPDISTDWIRQPLRVMNVIDNQVRSLRKRLLLASFDRDHDGAYWGTWSNMADLAKAHVPGLLPCPIEKTKPLAEMATRLTRIPVARRRALANWGYAIADASIRAGAPGKYGAPGDFPYPGGLG